MTNRDDPNMRVSSPNQDPAATEGQPDLTAFWKQVSDRMRSDIGEAAWRSWIRPLHIQSIAAGELQLSTDNRLTRERVNASYIDRLRIHAHSLRADINRIDLVLANNPQREAPPRFTDNPPVSKEARPSHGLDPRFTFANFVVGKPNELAFAAARRVAESDATVYNPLFLYGGVGLGKTHLMHAIAWEMRARYPQRKIAYLSAESFMYRFVNALRHQDMMSFKEQFRSVDMLMIDDVQFIAGKDSTQEEFFHTFNALVEDGRQVVLSADKSPTDLQGMEERLRSRLGWGLVADIHPANYEVRLGILQSRADNCGVTVPDKVLEFLAHQITTNIRELEGAFNRIVAGANLFGREITVESARETLSDLLRAANRRISIEDIQKQVASHFSIRTADMFSARRARQIARPRQIAMYLAKNLTASSYPEIGRQFGGRDHTTIMHAVRKIEDLMAEDSQLADDVQLLRSLLADRPA